MSDANAAASIHPQALELAPQIRAYLLTAPTAGLPLTYQALAQALGLRPPHTIHRLVLGIEQTMREDAAAGRPFLSALVVSRARRGLPAPGFFVLASRLGRYAGSESGPGAVSFHAEQLAAALTQRHTG